MPDILTSIREAIDRQGWTQRELARRSGVPQPNLSRILNGRPAKLETVQRIAAALGLEVTAQKPDA